MRKFKEVNTTTLVGENMEVETKTITTLHTIRTWEELTREEKEEEIQRRQESIYMSYQEDLYESFKADLDNLRYEFKNIGFDDIYIDSNSQGWWIDRIKNFKYYNEGIDIYGEHLEIEDIDFHIRKYINSFDINVYDYYIDSETLEKIEKTKKYKKWINDIEKEIQQWIDLVNEYCNDIASREYYCPYCLDNEEDKEWLDNYFMDEEFETIETIN